MEFTEVLRIQELPPGQSTVVTVAGIDIALFNVDGAIYAIDDACLHQGSSLGYGTLDGKIVTCRSHGWRYDVSTGSTIHVPGFGVACFPTKIIDDRIVVGTPGNSIVGHGSSSQRKKLGPQSVTKRIKK